ncbi:MAG: restriction endonuclease subunit S [Pseudomonadota bacterium]
MTCLKAWSLSGRSWLDGIPDHWSIEKLKRIISFVYSGVSVNTTDQPAAENEFGVLKTSAVQGGQFFSRENKLVWSTEYDRLACPVSADTIIMSRMNTPALVGESGYVLYDCPSLFLPDRLWQISFNNQVSVRFVSFLLASENIKNEISSLATGTSPSIKNLTIESMSNLQVPIPPIVEQYHIVYYLDRETAHNDTLIAEKEHMLALLEEKRAALISQAVTRGLTNSPGANLNVEACDGGPNGEGRESPSNPGVPLKPSGLDWLGDIPAHWETKRLKYLAQVRGGLTLGKRYSTNNLVKSAYLRVANVQDGYLELDEMMTVEVPTSEAKGYLLQYGVVLMNEGGDIGKLGRGCVWRQEISPCLHQNHVFAVRPFAVEPEWLALWTSTLQAKHYFESRAKRATNLASISGTNIKELPVPMPPVDEQERIRGYIEKSTERMAKLRSELWRTITLLKERRSALITAAVTGQLDIDSMNSPMGERSCA